MEYEAFIRSVSTGQMPRQINVLLQAMWYDASDNWQEAHTLAGSLHTSSACEVHAYLHRKEGDAGNAAYWYSRAGKPVPLISLQQEWEQIVKALLAGT